MADIAASVLAKLKNKAKASGISYQQCLQLFFQEEFLRRLAGSKYADNFILKGGLFIYTLTNFESRATVDVDFLMRGLNNDLAHMDEIIAEILAVDTGNDFVTFKAGKTEPIALQRKIGYATDVKQCMDELNRSTAVPFAFRIYATYEVDSALSDKKLHSILDKLNPELRSTENVDGKRRIREFYAMTPEDAYSILEAIAEINNYSHRLKKWKATATEQREEALAQEINEQHQERLAPFTFSACGIAVGEQIEFYCTGNANTGTHCDVVDDKHVTYNGETWSLTALAKHLTGTKSAIAGPRYFKYKGEWLNDIRQRMGA